MFAASSKVALAFALAAPLSTPERPPAPIYGGAPVAPGAWNSVVVVDFGVDFCTGTLITDRVVLTAGHCFTSFTSVPPPTLIQVKLGADRSNPEFTLSVETYKTHPQFCSDAASCDEDRYDFAYLLLDNPAPVDAVASSFLIDEQDFEAAMGVGKQLTIVGFGNDEDGVRGLKREAEVPITSFTPYALEFEAGGDGVDGCVGDSGGPAFALLPDGTAMLVGVSSRGTTCGEGGVYASVFPAMCWIGREFDIQWRESSNQCDGTCGCIDTPNILEGGCSVARPAGENRRPWLAVSLVIGYLGRRRRSRTPATDRSRHAARPR